MRTCYAFSPQPQIHPEHPSVCCPAHRGAVYGCQSSPSLQWDSALRASNERGQSPRVTIRGPAHTGTVSMCSSCRTPALRKQAAQPGLEMGLASRQGPRLSPRCGTCTIPCFPQLAKWSRTRGEDRSGVTPAPMISLLRECLLLSCFSCITSALVGRFFRLVGKSRGKCNDA